MGGLIFLALLLGAGFLFFDWGFLHGEVTTYPTMCLEETRKPPDCALMQLNRTTYRIDRQHKEVVYWLEHSVLRDELRKLDNCVIKDRTNWTCSFPDRSGKVHVRDGLETPYSERDAYVRKWQWYWLSYVGPTPFGWTLPEQLNRETIE